MAVIVKLLSKFDNSGIKKAKHEFGGLKKTIGAIGIGVGISQLSDLLIDSAKAASLDAKSQLLLNSQLKKNTKATAIQIKANEDFVQSVSNQVGIVDDDLRPALGKLVRVTKDVRKAQELLSLALDASATTGRPLESVTAAIAKAFTGNTTALIKLFPELKKSKDLFGDLANIVGGAAIQQANPFDKLNVAMDNLKEKLGAVVLPLITEFIDSMMKPGGAIDQVGKFLEDLTNPKTDAGKMFKDIKNAVKDAFGYVKDFFALFGNGDAMKGFGNVVKTLVMALPALIALKGILMLASAGSAIANLAKAVGLIQAGNAASGGGGALTKFTKNGMLSVAVRYAVPLAVTIGALEMIDAGFSDPAQRQKLADAGKNIVIPKPVPNSVNGIFVDKNGYNSSGDFVGLPGMFDNQKFTNVFGAKTPKQMPTTNVIINNYAADPKAVVDAVGKYIKQNGSLPFSFATGKAGR